MEEANEKNRCYSKSTNHNKSSTKSLYKMSEICIDGGCTVRRFIV